MNSRIIGLPGSGAWAFLARCLLAKKTVPGFSLPAFSGPLVLVRAAQNDIEDVSDAVNALEPLFSDSPQLTALFGEDPQARLASLERLRSGARLVLATPEAMGRPTFSPNHFNERTLTFSIKSHQPRAQTLSLLEAAGYRRVDFVESPGEYAVRGAVLDFFGLEPLSAVRVLYNEDGIESLRLFDPATQSAGAFLDSARAIASREPSESGDTLARWVSQDALWIIEEGLELAVPEGVLAYRAGRLLEGGPDDLDFGARPTIPSRGNQQAAWDEMRAKAAAGFKVILYSLNRGEDSRVQELLEGKLPPNACQFLTGPLRQGFSHEGLKLSVMSTSEIFERNYRQSGRLRYFSGSSRAAFRWAELRQGDYVVHQDYGLARYKGLKPIESPGHGTTDCLKMEFRGSDALYIPMTEFEKVQKYSGGEGKRPRLSSLDTRKWEEVKALVHEGVRELAEALLKLQAERRSIPGHAFPPESPMEREFAAAFPYEETPDQAKAISEVLRDMMEPYPMDRLVVGDVGFGKTEVAMRAAFKCVTGFKQAAVLVPTTILADQHFRTFTARFADYPVRFGMLSRFQTPSQQKKTIEDLAKGTVDVVIGTSRLLQKDIRFKDLGLVVIDEEHRFGVKDKERLKAMRKSVDFLALSATPIPRSLNQAFSGMRAISLIQSAPMGRQPIVTKVLPWDEERVASAISEELARGGQAYYVHNRVRTLPECVETLQKLLPQARFAMVHGKMKGDEIEEVMWDFFNRKYDVLVASTIIESGLDIPTVNALLVEDAHEFGLAQLYQLRGRIGRERQRAYCTLFYPAGADDFGRLSEEARKRLEALREFGELGAGMKLAMRDLEIRGAGDLLGAKQHGFMNAVGVEFYTEMLNEEIARKKGKSAPPPVSSVQMDFKLKAFIPEDYLPGEMERLEFYKRILRAKPEEVPALRQELIELSGPIPEPVANLFDLLRLRALAQSAHVRSISQSGKHIEVSFLPEAVLDSEVIFRWTKDYSGRLSFVPSPSGDGVRVDLSSEPPLLWIETFLQKMVGAKPLQKMIP